MVTCPDKSVISLPVLKGEKFCFSPTIFGLLLLLFDCFFVIFRLNNIVQILSFEQKLLLGIEYPFNRRCLLNNIGVRLIEVSLYSLINKLRL